MTTIGEELQRQSQGMGSAGFICRECLNYEGSCRCAHGIFIGFEGANLSCCTLFKRGKICRHCGKVT